MGILGDAFRTGRDNSRNAAQWATRRNQRGNPAGTGGHTGRINEWPRCRAQGCWRRIHPASVHVVCRRAWAYGAVELPDTHPGPCCPGECLLCRRCLDVCPGRCDVCGKCLDRCLGHDEDDNQRNEE